MQAESLEVLEKASVAPAHARAIVRAIEIELVRARRRWRLEERFGVWGVTAGRAARSVRGAIRAEGLQRVMLTPLAQAAVLLAFFCFYVHPGTRYLGGSVE